MNNDLIFLIVLGSILLPVIGAIVFKELFFKPYFVVGKVTNGLSSVKKIGATESALTRERAKLNFIKRFQYLSFDRVVAVKLKKCHNDIVETVEERD